MSGNWVGTDYMTAEIVAASAAAALKSDAPSTEALVAGWKQVAITQEHCTAEQWRCGE
jgi:hypothetical protein